MPTAAAPQYLLDAGTDTASPAQRFGLLLPIWTTRKDQKREVDKRADARSREGQAIRDLVNSQGLDAAIHELRQSESRPLPGLWDKNDFAARDAWSQMTKLTPNDKACMQALNTRQAAINLTVHENAMLALEAKAVAPFATGLGNEHPLENGFAFLNPYGLPYLAGSGVKGTVRRAAKELAGVVGIEWEDSHEWTADAVQVLFGDDNGDPQRGVLSFWDVVPQIKGEGLMVEIMTPHQSHYYQDGESPHESGKVTPIGFLSVPPESSFTFHVVCDLERLKHLAPELLDEGRWRRLMEAAFEHAFDWCGFGAKTAVGYGAMRRDRGAEADREQEQKERVAAQQEAERRSKLSPVERDLEEIIDRTKNDNPGAALLKRLEEGNWESTADQIVVARKIKQLWEADQKWNPNFTGKNRAKVRRRDRCLSVLRYLNSCS